jgi:glycosyltransferase involved in cell wall biosynthesis
MTMPMHVLFVVNVDWFFMSHRQPLARALIANGARVSLAASDTGCGPALKAEGIEFHPLPMSRHGINALGEVRTLAALLRLYGQLQPDLVHHVTIKPVLYGSIAARMRGVPVVVNAVSGQGSFLTADHGHSVLRRAVDLLYRSALHNPVSRTIFQNHEDRDEFVARGFIMPHQAVLIRGAGVDCARFVPLPPPAGPPIVMLPARMLWDKGVQAFVQAARIVRERLPDTRFVLVGDSDDASFMAVPRETLAQWQADGVVEWWGHVERMHEVLPTARMVVLPSRREGLPKVLLEAAACGLPVIAADVPGCREVVRPGVTGLLVPFGDHEALGGAILTLLGDDDACVAFGRAAREVAKAEFAEEIVVAQTMRLYDELLAPLRRARRRHHERDDQGAAA